MTTLRKTLVLTLLLSLLVFTAVGFAVAQTPLPTHPPTPLPTHLPTVTPTASPTVTPTITVPPTIIPTVIPSGVDWNYWGWVIGGLIALLALGAIAWAVLRGRRHTEATEYVPPREPERKTYVAEEQKRTYAPTYTNEDSHAHYGTTETVKHLETQPDHVVRTYSSTSNDLKSNAKGSIADVKDSTRNAYDDVKGTAKRGYNNLKDDLKGSTSGSDLKRRIGDDIDDLNRKRHSPD